VSSTLQKADNALLIVVLALGAFFLFGIFGFVLHLIRLAIMVVFLAAAIGVGVRVYGAVSGGSRRRELHR
jgi:hypothetical protein